MRTTTGISTEADLHLPQHAAQAAATTYKPEYIAAVWESGSTFREEAFADYKANRTEMPPDLGEQIPYIRRLLEAMRVPILEYRGLRGRRRDRRHRQARLCRKWTS